MSEKRHSRPPHDSQHALCVRLRLIKAREDAGLSQGQAAGILGIHRPTLGVIESGEQRLTVEMLLALCDLYGEEPGVILRPGYDLATPEPSAAKRKWHKEQGRKLRSADC